MILPRVVQRNGAVRAAAFAPPPFSVFVRPVLAGGGGGRGGAGGGRGLEVASLLVMRRRLGCEEPTEDSARRGPIPDATETAGRAGGVTNFMGFLLLNRPKPSNIRRAVAAVFTGGAGGP